MAKKSNAGILVVVVIIAAAAGAFIGYKYLAPPRERTTEEKINAAMEEMKKGFDRAADELEDKRPIDEINKVGKQMMEDINKAAEKNQQYQKQ